MGLRVLQVFVQRCCFKLLDQWFFKSISPLERFSGVVDFPLLTMGSVTFGSEDFVDICCIPEIHSSADMLGSQ